MRTLVRAGCLMLAAMAVAAPASAQVVHSLTLGAGLFMPRGFDTRVDGDVLYANLTQPDVLPGVNGSLDFDVKDFRSGTVFGEWNLAFGDRLEVGAGVGYQGRKVRSRYLDLIHGERPQRPEIEQDLRLRVIPVTGVVRFLPFGRAGSVQPYAGFGITVMNWRYSETGEFVDTTDFAIFQDRYIASGTTAGPVLLFGVRLPMGGDIYGLTLEYRHQWASGDTGGFDAGFLGDKFDLGGGHLNFGFLIRF